MRFESACKNQLNWMPVKSSGLHNLILSRTIVPFSPLSLIFDCFVSMCFVFFLPCYSFPFLFGTFLILLM